MDPRNNRASASDDRSTQRDAATKLVRDQLDAIYSRDPRVMTPAENTPRQQPQPQHQQHHQHQAGHQEKEESQQQGEHWQKYHTEWQQYYQKYYESYYVGQLRHAIKEKEKSELPKDEAAELQKKEDISHLREKIIVNAKSKAKSARKSRHFIPLFSALLVVVVVAFLQYNQLIIANVQAYVSPGAIDPQNIVIDPNSGAPVSSEPRLIIPKINVDVPVVYNVGYDHDSQMKAMQHGVAHFAIPGANSVPGQLGNTVLSGHSSNDLFDPGEYKFIFAQLDKLQTGDSIYLHYNSVRYTYTINKKEVVKPSNVGSLLNMTDKPYLTLITCTPLGTATNRLLIKAEQVAPDPTKAKAVDTTNTSGNDAVMAGNAPTILERLFGGR